MLLVGQTMSKCRITHHTWASAQNEETNEAQDHIIHPLPRDSAFSYCRVSVSYRCDYCLAELCGKLIYEQKREL